MPISNDPWVNDNLSLDDTISTQGVGDASFSDDPWANDSLSLDEYPSSGPKSTSLLSEAGRGLAAGVQNLKGFGYGIGALAGEVTGIDTLKQKSLEGLQETEATVKEKYAPAIGSYKDVGSFNDALKYLTYGVSTNIPNILASLASGGVGAFVGKKLAQKGVAGLTEEAAKNIASKYMKRGAMAGAGLSSIGMETGTIAGDQVTETGSVNPASALAGGLVAGALDFIPEWYLMKRLGWFGDEVTGAIGSRAAEIAKGFGKQFAMEAPTEAMQSVIERMSVPGKSISNREAWDEYIDSFILGGLTGGVAGGVGGILTKRRRNEADSTPTQNTLQNDPIANDIESQLAEVDVDGVTKVDIPEKESVTPVEENIVQAQSESPELQNVVAQPQPELEITPESTIPEPTPELPPANLSAPPEIVESGANGEVVGAKADEQGREITSITQKVEEAAKEAATSPNNDLSEPSEAQKDAGNYKKGHVSIQGLAISIENPAGSSRKGVDEEGYEWETPLANHYGYIKKTEGSDGDHVDAFIGPNPESQKVFIVDQQDPKTQKFDEHKTMIGFDTIEQAQDGYLSNYDESGPFRIQNITEMPMDQFKEWLKGDTTKPVGEVISSPPITPDYESEAKSLGLIYKGRMGNVPGKPDMIHFTDPTNAAGSFSLLDGESLSDKLAKEREKKQKGLTPEQIESLGKGVENVPKVEKVEKVAEVDQVSKEPWQMTQAEYIPAAKARLDKENGWRTEYKKNLTPAAKSEHKVLVEQATKEGKPVPEYNLKQYGLTIPTVAKGTQATKEKIAKVKTTHKPTPTPIPTKGKGTAEAKAKIAERKNRVSWNKIEEILTPPDEKIEKLKFGDIQPASKITIKQVMDHYEFPNEVDRPRQLAKEMADYINGLPEQITVYRAVSADDLKSVETGEFIGEHWTPNKQSAIEFARDNLWGSSREIYVIKGVVNKRNIDLVRSAALNAVDSEENELFIPYSSSKKTVNNIEVVDKKTAKMDNKFGDIQPEDQWDGYGDSLSPTVRQQWQTKLEEFEDEFRRTEEENRIGKDAGDSGMGGENGISVRRRLRDRRLFDAQVQRANRGNDRERWKTVSLAPGFGKTIEFKFAEKHFESLGYQTVPINRVPWGMAVNHDDKVVFMGRMMGDRFAYFMSHETSHILTEQGNKSALAVKDSVDLTNPKVIAQREGRDWTDDYTKDEVAAAIIGGTVGLEDVLVGDQTENVKQARKDTGSFGKLSITKNGKSEYGDIIPANIKQSITDLTNKFQSNPQSTVPDEWIKNDLQPFLKSDNDFRFKDRYLGLPWWNAKRYPAWRRAFEIFGIERPEDRGRLMHSFSQVAEPFFKMEENMKKAGRSAQAIAESKDRINRVIITGDAQLGPYLKSLRAQYREMKDGPERNIIADKIAQIETDNRYSDEQLLAGIKDDRGQTVKLTQQEVDVYKSVRASLDTMFDSYTDHLNTQTFRNYRNQKWYSILCQAVGMDLTKEQTMNIVGNGLNRAALLKSKSIQPNIQRIFARAEQAISETPDAEKMKAGELYGKLADKMTKEISELRNSISELSGVTDPTELTKMAKDVFSAYLMVRPQTKKVKALRNLYKKQVAFFPRVREQGKYKAKLIENIYDDEGNLIDQKQLYMKMFSTEKEGREVYSDIMARFGKDGKLPPNTKIVPEQAVQTPEFAFQGVNDINMQKLLDDAIEGLKIRETYYNKDGQAVNIQDHLRDLGFEAIAKQFQSRGFGRHMTHRQSSVVKGYEENGLESVLFNYMSGMSGIMTKQISAADFLEHMKSVKDPKMFEALNKYGHDQLRNETGMDKLSNKVRSFMFSWYLGGVLRPAIIQLTQNFVTGIPKHAQWLRENNLGGAGKADKDYIKSMKDMAFKNLSEVEARMEAQLFTDGVTVDQYIREIFGSIGNKWNQNLEKWMHYLAIPFSYMEIYNRQSAALTRFRPSYKLAMAKVGKGFTEEDAYNEAFDSARSFVYDTHYAMGKANLPQIAQGEGVGTAIKTLYTFKSFTHNFALSTYYDMAAGDWKTVMHSMAYLSMFGGLLGLPFLDDLFEFIEKHFGYSPATAVRQSLRGMGGKTLEQFGMNGLPAMLGMNMSGSLAMGVPFMGTTPESTIGGVYEGQRQKMIRAWDAFTRADYYRVASNLAPELLRGPITAAQESQVGKELFGTPGSATTTRGGLVYDKEGKPLSMTGYQAALKSVGFTPLEYSREKEMDATIKRQKAWVDGRKSDIAETYRVMKINKDPDAMRDMIRAVRDLNQDIKYRDLTQLVPRATIGKIIQSSRQIKNLQERRQEKYKRAEL